MDKPRHQVRLGLTSWETALQRKTTNSSGVSNVLWQLAGTELYQQECCQQVEEGDPSPLLSPGETRLECWVQCWAAQCKTWAYWMESSEGP